MMITSEQSARLNEIHEKLCPQSTSTQATTANPGRPPSLPTTKSNARGRPFKTVPPAGEEPSAPKTETWKGVKDITELTLESELIELIEEIKQKPRDELVAHIFGQYEPQYLPSIEHVQPSSESLAKLCLALSKRKEPFLYSIGWFFETLAVGDMVVALFGKKKTIDRLSKKVGRDVEQAVAEGDRSVDTSGMIQETLTIACNVFFICETLGTGSLFFLRPKLIKNL